MTDRTSLLEARRRIRDALWESPTETGFAGIPTDQANAIIGWFAEREAAQAESLDRAERLNGALRGAFRRRMREWREHGRDYGYGEEDVEEFLLTAEREADLPTEDDITGILDV